MNMCNYQCFIITRDMYKQKYLDETSKVIVILRIMVTQNMLLLVCNKNNYKRLLGERKRYVDQTITCTP